MIKKHEVLMGRCSICNGPVVANKDIPEDYAYYYCKRCGAVDSEAPILEMSNDDTVEKAALELVQYIVTKYDVKDSSEFKCGYTLKLFDALVKKGLLTGQY